MKQRLLITGGTGFLGSFLVEALKNEYAVVATSRQTSSANTVQLDINNVDQVNTVFTEVKPDIVLHLAAMSSLAVAQKNPLQCIAINIEGSTNLISASLANNVNAFVHFSSNKAVYPKNIYGHSKAVIESALKALSTKGSSYFSYRCGNIIGSPDSFLDQWFTMQRQGETIRSSGGNAERFFTTREEIAKDLLLLLREHTSLASTIVTPKMKSARIGDFLGVFEQQYGVAAERTESRSFDNQHDYLVSGEEAAYTQSSTFAGKAFWVIGNTPVNAFNEAISTQNNTHKLSDEEMASWIEYARLIRK
ncbi:MAG: polysaccharide biosynthesis protein [Chitinophagales bacterium]|nr:polysaccharide biosynthesis protein [Chitinophagales bacterium]